MMTVFPPIHRSPQTAAAASVHFEAKRVKPLKLEGAVAWVDPGLPPNEPVLTLVTEPNQLQSLIGRIPVLMYLPYTPVDYTKKVGFKVSAPSTAGRQDLHSPRIVVDQESKTITVNLVQNISNAGVMSQISTANAFMYADKASLPKELNNYDLKLKIKKA